MRLSLILLSLSILVLLGCTSENLKRSAYEAVYQKECLDRTQTPNCDPAHPSYNKYEQKRKEETVPTHP